MSTSASLLTTNQWLNLATAKLADAGIATARLDCLVLLEDATGRDRSWLLAHPDTDLSQLVYSRAQGRTLRILNKAIVRRTKHEPLAYIRGKSEFYGREFMVNNYTLEPRPETETMIDLAKQLIATPVVFDIGTGSGCIAITLKLELPHINAYATDIDKQCLKIAQQNAGKLNADIKFYEGNLLSAVKELHPSYSLVCNLPYVPAAHTINPAAMHEPPSAIFGGSDGLDLYRQLFKQIEAAPTKPSLVLTESLPYQHSDLALIAQRTGYHLTKSDDFIQVFSR